VKTIQRQAIAAAALLAVGFVSEPMTAGAQGRNGPRLTMFVGVSFKSPGDPKLGIEVAEAMRQRLIKMFPQTPQAFTRAGALRIITREQINQQLVAAAYPADSVITSTDLRDLGKNLGVDESMEGTAQRTDKGVEVHARFYSLNHIDAPEVLPAVVDKDAGGAGREVADLYTKARRELPDYERCRSALISRNYDQAIVSAKAALVQWDKGVLPRACMMGAYMEKFKAKAIPADSVIAVANQILTFDPNYEIAIGTLADVYLLKGDTIRAVEMNLRLYKLNPTNVAQAQTIVQILAGTGSPEKALPIVKDLLTSNPGDSQILETEWKLLQATKQWKEAIAAGEEMVKFDSAKADTNYFNRQIAAAFADSQPQLILQFLGRATAKFPKNVRFWLAYSQELRKAGQLQQAMEAARKASAIDPKSDQAYGAQLTLYVQLGQPDSALAVGKQAIANGGNREAIGGALLALVGPALSAAQKTDKMEDWQQVYRMAAVVDSLVPQPATAFSMSFAAYSMAANLATKIQETAKTDKAGACAAWKTASDLALTVQLNMGRGGKFNPDAAARILNALGQLQPYLDAQKKPPLSCK